MSDTEVRIMSGLSELGAQKRSNGILCVDDDHAVASMYVRCLEIFTGYQAHVFTCPVKALEQFLKRPVEYGLVITDYNMPKLNGAELAGEIRARRPELPIMAVTGNVYDCRPEDFDLIQEKPFALCDFQKNVGRLLGLHLPFLGPTSGAGNRL